MGAEDAGVGRRDIHLLNAVKAVPCGVTEQTLRGALLAEIATVQMISIAAYAAVGRAIADQAVRYS